MNIYFWLYGGYGDCLAAYLNGGRGKYETQIPGKNGKGSVNWTILNGLKKRFPRCTTRAIIISGNPQSANLARNNPFIDEVIALPTLYKVNTVGGKLRKVIDKYSVGYSDIDENRKITSQCDSSNRNRIFLSEQDETQLVNILSQVGDKYLVIHPFASTDTRISVQPISYLKLAERIYEQTKMKSIILGGSYIKTSRRDDGERITTDNKEEFVFESPAILNLVNKANLLVGSRLVLGARVTIGAWSCHTTCAMATTKPSIIFTTRKSIKYLRPISERKFPKALESNLTFVTNSVQSNMIEKVLAHINKYQ